MREMWFPQPRRSKLQKALKHGVASVDLVDRCQPTEQATMSGNDFHTEQLILIRKRVPVTKDTSPQTDVLNNLLVRDFQTLETKREEKNLSFILWFNLSFIVKY